MNQKLIVSGAEITVMTIDDKDYISLTDILRAKDGDFSISDWLRNRNTVEFLGIWEQIHNPNFKVVEFDVFVNEKVVQKGTKKLSSQHHIDHRGHHNVSKWAPKWKTFGAHFISVFSERGVAGKNSYI